MSARVSFVKVDTPRINPAFVKACRIAGIEVRPISKAEAAPAALTGEQVAFVKALKDPRQVDALARAFEKAKAPALPSPAEKVARRRAHERAADAVALEQLERLGEAIRRKNPKLSKEQAFVQAAEERPDLYGRAKRYQNGRSEGLAKAAVDTGDRAEQEIERRAGELVRKSSDLSHGEAVLRVLEQEPELYDRHVRGMNASHRLAEEAVLAKGETARRSRDEAYARIEKAAGDLRREEPTLTPEEAIIAVCERHPELYAAYRGEGG